MKYNVTLQRLAAAASTEPFWLFIDIRQKYGITFTVYHVSLDTNTIMDNTGDNQ